MYLFGFSLDNISLLALTLSVGLDVDDAIVMLENIYRHMEEDGLGPFEAALKGSREIGFTIISITFSLIAVFIPLLLMGGVVGRLFHEFAVTVAVAVLMSAFVSLTLGLQIGVAYHRYVMYLKWLTLSLLAYAAVLSARSVMTGQSRAMRQFWFAAASALAMLVGFLLSALDSLTTPNLFAVFWQFLATALLYPFAHRLIERFEDADVRFR